MTKLSFESLNEYQKEDLKYFVAESLILEKGDDEDGGIGTIIDRGLSFVPRAIRFKKAKKMMKKALSKFTSKAINVIEKFSAGFKDKVTTIDKEYKKLMADKVKPLIDEDKTAEAVSIIEAQKKEIEEYKKDQMAILQKGIDDVLVAYTNAIEHRIDKPGFVLNVELSEKGKGELRAKWQELAAIQKIEIDKHKTKLIHSPGWRRLEAILAEMESFIKQRKHKELDIDLLVQDIAPSKDGYLVKVHVRVTGGRVPLQEKGLLIGSDPNKLTYSSGARKIKVTGTYQYNANPYELFIHGDASDFVKPYMIFKDIPEPVYGDVASLNVRKKGAEEKKMGDDRVIAKTGSVEDEKNIIPPENK